ncbi:MAG: hypothetical protein SLRJCFUN_002184 [Candidatus Fervidibacter sp.]
MLRVGWLALLLVMASVAVAGEGTSQEPAEPNPSLLRIEGSVRGIIVGLHRATLAILSPQQVMTYLHVPLSKLPDWVRTGTTVIVLYRINENGEFWAEQISPPVSGEPKETRPNMPTVLITPLAPQTQTEPSRQGSLMEWRQRSLPSRGLNALQARLRSSFNPMESEVQRLLPHYRAAVKFFNPNLTDEQVDAIASTIIRCGLRHGIDPRLIVAVIACESSFRPNAVGKKGEIGLGQLKPETAADLGVNPYDPIQNIDGCARYLRQQLERFGDVALALAAYNAGPNAVLKAGGIPQNGITPRYVQKVLDLYRRLCGQP